MLVTFAAHFSVYARGKRIGNAQVVASGTADSYTEPAEWKMVGARSGYLTISSVILLEDTGVLTEASTR